MCVVLLIWLSAAARCCGSFVVPVWQALSGVDASVVEVLEPR